MEEKGTISGNLGLKGQKLGKAEVSARAIDHRRPTIERTSTRAPKTRNDRTCARAHKKRDRAHNICDRVQSCNGEQ